MRTWPACARWARSSTLVTSSKRLPAATACESSIRPLCNRCSETKLSTHQHKAEPSYWRKRLALGMVRGALCFGFTSGNLRQIHDPTNSRQRICGPCRVVVLVPRTDRPAQGYVGVLHFNLDSLGIDLRTAKGVPLDAKTQGPARKGSRAGKRALEIKRRIHLDELLATPAAPSSRRKRLPHNLNTISP
jgi:hypothetical protein